MQLKNIEARQRRIAATQKLAAVSVADEDVALVAHELMLSDVKAREDLQRHGGDVEATLRAFVAS